MLQVSDGLAVMSCGAGLLGAAYWLRSSLVPINPTWVVEPGDERRSQDEWIAGPLQALSDASRLNKHAAVWSAISIAAAGFTALAGRMGF